MGIRFLHTHEGHACYRTSERHLLTEKQVFSVGGKTYAIAYMGYTGSYYLFDTETGKEIGSITRRGGFRETLDLLFALAGVSVGELVADTEGLCAVGADS